MNNSSKSCSVSRRCEDKSKLEEMKIESRYNLRSKNKSYNSLPQPRLRPRRKTTVHNEAPQPIINFSSKLRTRRETTAPIINNKTPILNFPSAPIVTRRTTTTSALDRIINGRIAKRSCTIFVPPKVSAAQKQPKYTYRNIEKNVYSAEALSTLKKSKPIRKTDVKNIGGCEVFIRSVKRVGEGLFARETIPPRKFIGELVGEVFTEEEQLRRVQNGLSSGKYAINLNNLVIDAEFQGNMIRKVNHSCCPNVAFKTRNINGFPTLWLHAKSKIERNQQITVSYGESYAGFGIECACDSKHCSGVVGK